MFCKSGLISARGQKGAIICATFNRFYSQDLRVIKNLDPAYLKRGTGGRSSFNGNVVTVFGATGFLGRFICNQLGKIGCQIIIPYRCDVNEPRLKNLKLVGDLGQVLYHPFDLRDPVSIRKAIKYSNVVINLIGRDYESVNFNFYQVHIKGCREIAKACKEYNIERLIHFSSLNVTDKPQKYYVLKSDYLPSKLKGEEAVLNEFPTATIFRPGPMYGKFDRFLWPLCARKRKFRFSIPLYARGEKTIRQPVYAGDVAKGVINAMNDYSTREKIFQAVGPERFYLKDIAVYLGKVLQRGTDPEKLVHDIKFDPTFPLKAIFFRHLIGFLYHEMIHHIGFELIERESVTDVVDKTLPTLLDLGVPLTKFEDVVPNMVFIFFRRNPASAGYYDEFEPFPGLSDKAISPYGF